MKEEERWVKIARVLRRVKSKISKVTHIPKFLRKHRGI